MKTIIIIPIFLSFAFNVFPCTDNSRLRAGLTHEGVGSDTSVTGVFKALKLVKVIQSKTASPKETFSFYESAINSPKSAIYSKDGSKFYINSLEGHKTVVFDAKTLKKRKEIHHKFNAANNQLFKQNEVTVFDYAFKQKRNNYNEFLGKPVESCLSHNGKYLWVTYYRRDWDPKAESPSALAIIDTDKDEIVRVLPTGPLPKMIACSWNNKLIAVSHWGDNTVALIDIAHDDPMDFSYTAHITVDYRLNLNFSANTNRDENCGNCLRGTVFTPDDKILLVAKMGGDGIAMINIENKKYIGTITGSYLNIRHLVMNKDVLYLSSNKYGIVQKAKLNELLNEDTLNIKKVVYSKWQTAKVGTGARTIDVTEDGKYIFACVNNDSKIVVINASNMNIISEEKVAQFPVGMALSPDGKQLIITSQGKSAFPGTGNTVTCFEVLYQ